MTDKAAKPMQPDYLPNRADIDAALWSNAVYASPEMLKTFNTDANETFGDLTAKQTAYLRKNFELLDVRDFGRTIHAVTVRDRRTGGTTIAFPGTNFGELRDVARAVGISWGSELDVYDQAEAYIREMRIRHKEPVLVTGHSAGGTVAVEMGRRLDDTIVREVVGFQTPGTVRSTDPWGSEWGGNEPQYEDLVDGKRIRTINGDGDFVGNFGARAGQHGTHDVSKGGAETGFLENHSSKNMTNTRIEAWVERMRELAAEAGISDPTLDAELEELAGLAFPAPQKEQSKFEKEMERFKSSLEQKALGGGGLPQSQAGNKAAGQGAAGAAAATPGPQSRAPAGVSAGARGWDSAEMTKLAQSLEAGKSMSFAQPLGRVTEKTAQMPDQTMELRNGVAPDSARIPLTEEMGSFAAVNRRRVEARGIAGDQGKEDRFGFARGSEALTAAGGKASMSGKQTMFDQTAFLNTPLDRLDEQQVRRAMMQPAYYQSWRPDASRMNEHVTNWFRRAYPG